MNGLKELHDQQDEFIKKTLQEDKIINQPMFESYEQKMNQTKVKVKKYSYKQQKVIILLLLLLAISLGFNFYLAVVKQTPITINNIFEPGISNTSSKEENNNDSKNTSIENETLNQETTLPEDPGSSTQNDNTDSEEQKNNPTVDSEKPSVPTVEPKPEPEVITPDLFTDINTNEVEDFVNQFAIGINKLKLDDTSNLESNTILLYIAQQYFSSKSNTSTSLTVDTSYASSAENFHKFLSEFTINDYSTISSLKSYTNYIKYVSRSKSYTYGTDYSTISKEKYKCEDVTIVSKEDNIYTAKAKVTRTYEEEESTYEVTFTFKVNTNYKYQKYKLLSLNPKITSGNVDKTIHLVGTN